MDREFRIRQFTPEARRFFRLSDADKGRSIEDMAGTVDLKELLKEGREALERIEIREMQLTTVDEEIDLIVRIVPSAAVFDDSDGIVFTLIDVTELQRTKEALVLARNEAQSRMEEVEELYRVSPGAMALIDRDMRYIRLNQRLADINGYSIEEHYGRRLDEMVPELGRAVIEPVERVFATGEALLDQEVVGHTSANPVEEAVWIVDWYPLRENGEVIAVGVNVRDITSYSTMQNELKRVMRELQHRVKNMLANVNALVNRAKRDNRASDEVLEALSSRISALAMTHQLLTTENWKTTRIAELLYPELTEVYGEDVVTLRGPDVRLNSRATLSIGMAIHELATNAAKYGALSTSTGRLSVSWSKIDEGDGEQLRIIWAESGGPEISAPQTSGFGSTLIQSTIEGSLGGKVEFSWEPKGLICVLAIPLREATTEDTDIGQHLLG